MYVLVLNSESFSSIVILKMPRTAQYSQAILLSADQGGNAKLGLSVLICNMFVFVQGRTKTDYCKGKLQNCPAA